MVVEVVVVVCVWDGGGGGGGGRLDSLVGYCRRLRRAWMCAVHRERRGDVESKNVFQNPPGGNIKH